MAAVFALELKIMGLCAPRGFLLIKQRMVGLVVVAVIMLKGLYFVVDGEFVSKLC